jgi:hypothetical protein
VVFSRYNIRIDLFLHRKKEQKNKRYSGKTKHERKVKITKEKGTKKQKIFTK